MPGKKPSPSAAADAHNALIYSQSAARTLRRLLRHNRRHRYVRNPGSSSPRHPDGRGFRPRHRARRSTLETRHPARVFVRHPGASTRLVFHQPARRLRRAAFPAGVHPVGRATGGREAFCRREGVIKEGSFPKRPRRRLASFARLRRARGSAPLPVHRVTRAVKGGAQSPARRPENTGLMIGRSNVLRMAVFDSRSSRKRKLASRTFSAPKVPAPIRRMSASETCTRCCVVVSAFTVTASHFGPGAGRLQRGGAEAGAPSRRTLKRKFQWAE